MIKAPKGYRSKNVEDRRGADPTRKAAHFDKIAKRLAPYAKPPEVRRMKGMKVNGGKRK